MAVIVNAPFTGYQMSNIEGYQNKSIGPPLRCPYDKDVLRVSLECLTCPICAYQLRWVPAYTADGSWLFWDEVPADVPRMTR